MSILALAPLLRAEGAPADSPSVTPIGTSTKSAPPATAPTTQPAPPATVTQPAYPPPAYPPPAYPPPAYPPPGYPPGYAPPPPYALPPRLVGPRRLPYEEGQAVPPGYHIEEQSRHGPTLSGTLLLTIPYAIGLTIGSLDNFHDQTSWLAVPAIGPWLMLLFHKNSSCGLETDCTDPTDSLRTTLILDGILQGVGTGLLIYGLSGSKVLIRNDYAYFVVTPSQVGAAGYGAAAVGRF